MLVDRHDIGVGRFLGVYGEYFEDEVQLMASLCAPGATIVDAGANIGAHTLPLAKAVGPTGKVFAFEPQRRPFQLLAANVALNGLDNVECIRAALGETGGELRLGDLPGDAPANVGGATLADLGGGSIPTPIYTLDAFLPDVSGLRLIKIDVEGMELEVLKGAQGLIDRHRPFIYAENNQPEKSAALIGFLRAAGYRVYWHMPSHFRADNFYKNPKPLMPDAIVEPTDGGEFLVSMGIAINVLCVPPGAVVPDGREVAADEQEHPLKRPYSGSFMK
jgi:FkbM family methyltransferase